MASRCPKLKTWPLCTVITVCKTCGEEVIFLRLKEADIKMDHKGTDINWIRKGYAAKFL